MIMDVNGGDSFTSPLVGSKISKASDRAAACVEVEEANAAIGAAVSTGSLPLSIVVILRDVQNDLLDVADDLGKSIQGETVVKQHHIDRILSACTDFQADSTLPESALLAGWSNGAGLLRLARGIVRRAERTTWALAAGNSGQYSTLAAAYLGHLADLLVHLAVRADETELIDLPVSIEGSPLMSNAAPGLPQWVPGRAWRYGTPSDLLGK